MLSTGPGCGLWCVGHDVNEDQQKSQHLTISCSCVHSRMASDRISEPIIDKLRGTVACSVCRFITVVHGEIGNASSAKKTFCILVELIYSLLVAKADAICYSSKYIIIVSFIDNTEAPSAIIDQTFIHSEKDTER